MSDGDEQRTWRALRAWKEALRAGPGAPSSELRAPPVDEGDGLLGALYVPLLRDLPATCAVAHLAQSLDGRIATERGSSQWLSGPEGLRHAHRMRALFDAVVVGTETARLDDPQLTVRHVDGTNPVRVVLDPSLSLPPSLRLFTDGLAETLVVASEDAARGRTSVGQAEILALASEHGVLPPARVLDALARRGLRRVYVEGGGVTVSRFLAAGCLARLHLVIAPVIVGSGRPSLVLPPVDVIGSAVRPRTRTFHLGADILVDCAFEEG